MPFLVTNLCSPRKTVLPSLCTDVELLWQVASSFRQHRVNSSRETGAAVGEEQLSGRWRLVLGARAACWGQRDTPRLAPCAAVYKGKKCLDSPKRDVFEGRSGDLSVQKVFLFGICEETLPL